MKVPTLLDKDGRWPADMPLPTYTLLLCEAAAYLRMCTKTLQREAAAGHIRGIRTGRGVKSQWRFTPEAIREAQGLAE